MIKRSKVIWVVKVGSQLLIDEGPLFVRSLVNDILEIKKKYSVSVILVSSGAIASARMRIKKKWETLSEKQALSALGQPMMMDLYNTAFQTQGQLAAQVLLTAQDLKNSESKKNLLNTLEQLLLWGVTPILNENDALATEEIQFGDNDFLSSLVACEIKAKKLILMTNVEGIFNKNPKEKDAKLIVAIKKITRKQIIEAQSQLGSQMGRGGVASKLKSSKLAAQGGITTFIVKGAKKGILQEIAQGLNPGTVVFPEK